MIINEYYINKLRNINIKHFNTNYNFQKKKNVFP